MHGKLLTRSSVTVVSIYRVPQMKLAREDGSCMQLLVKPRLLFMAHTDFEATDKDVDAAIWSAIEICVGIVSASLPTLRPIITFLSGSVRERKLWTKSSFSNSRTMSRDFQNLQAGDLEMPGMVHYTRSVSTLGLKPMSPMSPMSPTTPTTPGRNDRSEGYSWVHNP